MIRPLSLSLRRPAGPTTNCSSRGSGFLMPDWASRDSQPSRLVYLPDAVAAVKAAFAAGRAAGRDDVASAQASVKHVAERAYGEGRALAKLPDGVLAFVNWFAEGPCACDGEPDDLCDSCRALALLAVLDGTAAALPDPPGEFDNPYDGKDRAVYAEGFGRGYHAGRITAAALPERYAVIADAALAAADREKPEASDA